MSDRWGVAFYDFLKPPPGLGGGVLEGASPGKISVPGAAGGRGIRPSSSRRRQVKRMLRVPFEQWRDVGLSGYGFDGARRAGWRGRNEDRDVAFVDGLYGTGLRLQEWGSVLDVEAAALFDCASFRGPGWRQRA